MASIKCKMCGGDLHFEEGATVAECEYCGSVQTIPNVDNEKKVTLFVRANRLRAACEFDKAAGVYESIVAEFPEEAEAYWGLVLCRYGIEYVDDPRTGKKIPTCHRSSFDSVMEDTDFEQACENADVVARRIYREEAKAIEELRKGILEVSGKEAPYDIFICYKETDDKGDRTIDSVIAQDVYDALTEKGYRVFFSRISLEDKLGTEYEPYIFAALNSAKVMLVFGTDYEYFNAVWVKNEWSRFLALIAAGQKKTLIPCYKGIDAYDMPKEFARLQGQDMGKVGAVQDLLRGIDKICGNKAEQAAGPAAVQQTGLNVAALLKRAEIELEDSNWDKAKELLDQVLNMDPERADAYVFLFMAEHKLRNADKFTDVYVASKDKFSDDRLLKRARQYDAHRFIMLDEAREQKIADDLKKLEEGKAGLAQIRKRLKTVPNILCYGEYRTVGLRSDGTVVAVGKNECGQCNVSDWRGIMAIAAGARHTVGLRADGTVVAVGENVNGQCNVSNWRDIMAIATGSLHTVSLRSDGTVVAVGKNDDGRCNVSDWKDIVAVAASALHTVGLRSDGTVVAVGKNDDGRCNVSDWRDIMAIATGGQHTVGLRADGTVVAVGYNKYGQCNVSDWRDIVAVAASSFNTVGLRSDGTVVAVGMNYDGRCDVSNWRNIVAVAAGISHTVGLRSDGTVVAVGENDDGKRNVYDWKDIVAVFAFPSITVGLRSDGTVVAVGENAVGERNVERWKLFNSLDTLEQEREDTRRRAERRKKQEEERMRAEEEERQRRLKNERDDLEHELAGLKGLFAGKRRKEIEARLAEIARQLR